MFKVGLITILVALNSYGVETVDPLRCPLQAHKVVMFIDSCPTTNADYLTNFYPTKSCTRKDHAEMVIKTYHDFGGEKKTWLWTYYYNDSNGEERQTSILKAIEAAMYCGVKVINFSGGGISYSGKENSVVRDYLHFGGTLIAAAGNEGRNIDISDRIARRKELQKSGVIKSEKKIRRILNKTYQAFYPASYKGVIAVGGIPCDGGAKFSGYGSKVVWELGCDKNELMIGSSLATPRHTAKLEVKQREEENRRKDAENRRKAEWQRRCRELKAKFCDRRKGQ